MVRQEDLNSAEKMATIESWAALNQACYCKVVPTAGLRWTAKVTTTGEICYASENVGMISCQCVMIALKYLIQMIALFMINLHSSSDSTPIPQQA